MNMHANSLAKVAVVSLLSVCAGCATWDSMDHQEKGTAAGATGGALVGAAVGGPVGALVGAGVGGYAGHYETEPGGIAATNGAVSMNERRDVNAAPSAQPRNQEIASSGPTTYPASGDEVSSAQRALNDRGFDAGAIDGMWGPNTQQAVAAFQRANGLPATGVLDQRTLDALGVRQ